MTEIVDAIDIKHLTSIVRTMACEELLPGFGRCEFDYKEDGSVITRQDVAMQERLNHELAQAWPQFSLLGEEMDEQEQFDVINSGNPYWCVDPLDGTSNYAAGLPMYAVSIALIINGESQLGLIYDPTHDEMFYAKKNSGAFLNGERLKMQTNEFISERVLAEIEFKRLPKDLVIRLMTEQPFDSQRNSGSSAIDWCWLAAGRFDVYLHGGQKLWDYAAGHLIFAETGGESVSLDGEPVFRNRLETRSVLAAGDSKLFQRWYDWAGLPLKPE